MTQIPDVYEFSNGNYIFRNEEIILPTSPEGQRIEKLLKLKKKHKKINDEQKALFKQISQARNSQIAIEILIRGKSDANLRNPTPLDAYKFSNGNFIFRNDTLIKPTSEEGRNITKILKDQDDRKKLNEKQKQIVKDLTDITTSLGAIKYLIKSNRNPSFVLSNFQPSTKNLRKKSISKAKSKRPIKLMALSGLNKIPLIQQKKAVAIRLDKVLIKDLNSRIRKKASIIVITTVSDGTKENPVMVTLDSYDNIREGCKLPMSQVMMYHKESEQLPSFLDGRILIVKSNQGIRNIGTALSTIKDDSQYKSAIDALVPLLAGGVLTEAVKTTLNLVVQIIGNVLKTKKDDKLLFYPFSLIRVFDGYKLAKCDNNKYAEICYKVQSLTD